VTGGSTGIGAAVAMAFAGCGAIVGVHYNSSRDEAEAVAAQARSAGARAFTEQADLTVNGSAGALVERVVARQGRLDILINNAGTIIGRRPTTDIDDHFYRSLIDLNLTSVVMSCRAVIPVSRKQRSGTIINITSIAARLGGGPGTTVYAAMKAAVATFTRGLAKELALDGIRVNAVAPGVIQTPLHDRFTPPEVMEAFRASIPLGRLGIPADMVGAYLFLASDDLAGYITGQVVEVNGGMLMP
jgi:3-oxoacyl-[acyl-carrier protein] reductase